MTETDDDLDYLCIGVCLADDDEKYCIGCGRPWGQRQADDWDDLNMPGDDDASADPEADDAEPASP